MGVDVYQLQGKVGGWAVCARDYSTIIPGQLSLYEYPNGCSFFSSHQGALWTALSQRKEAAGGEEEGKSHFGLANRSVHPIKRKIAIGLRSKVQNRPNVTHKSHFGVAFGSHSTDMGKIWHGHTNYLCGGIFHFFQNPRWQLGVKNWIPFEKVSTQKWHKFGKWIPFIRFKQNLAGTYYFTLETSQWKNFWFVTKCKMAAAATVTSNYEIGHNSKSIQLRDPIVFSDACLQG